MSEILQKKMSHLHEILREMGNILVAYSGGVDSTFLLAVAVSTGCRVEAATAVSPTYTPDELNRAKQITALLKVPHHIVQTNELSDPCFSRNSPDRCYFCKKELFTKLQAIANRQKLSYVVDGTNADDFSDYRPGMKAREEAHIRSPLAEAGFTKEEIREASRKMALPTWNIPAQACLASRFPYGMEITEEQLKRVYEAEKIIKNYGFDIVRVRNHGEIARIEVSLDKLPDLLKPEVREAISTSLKKLGYTYITVDMDGYRTGSMNEILSNKKISGQH
jgi:uncharacterized protein